VTPNRPAELEDEFAPGKGEKGNRREPGIRMPVYMDIIGKLRAEEAPAELLLTPEQDQKIKAASEEFRTAMREYAQKNGINLDGRPGGGRRNPEGARPAGAPGDEMAPAEQARREELRRNAPKPVDAQAKIWNVLSAPQQTFVKGELDKARAEMEKKRGEEYMRKEIEKRKAGKEGGAAQAPEGGRPVPPGPEGGPPPEVRERVQRIFERLRQLSPQDRDAVLRHLEEDLDRHAGDMQDRSPADPPPPKKPAGGGKGRNGVRPGRPGDEALPPPDMDGVKVPPARQPG